MVEIKTEENTKKKKKKNEKKKEKMAERTKTEITAKEDYKDKEKKSLKMENSQVKTSQQQQQENTSNNKRKRKVVFPYGNYRNYYGYRIGKEMEEDPRLRVLKREWFEGKDCLDIGCNSGIIIIHIAKKFHCHRIRGIDIDDDLIQEAYWNLRNVVRKQNSGKIGIKSSRLGVPEKENCPEQRANVSVEQEEIASNGLPQGRELSEIVSFRKENFVDSLCPPKERYDTILCLSVTKWIHLNWGDDGLLTLFSKIWMLLRPGGILVLEPQPWRSYESKHHVSETASMNYRTIMFRPECFQEILLDKIGFRTVEDITSGLSGSKTGFDRPIFAFHK